MGNRAVIFFEKDIDVTNLNEKYAGVYLHWNGGPDSVYIFLEYLKSKNVRWNDSAYAMARFVQVVANMFGGTLSVGVDTLTFKNAISMGSDNGIYCVDWSGPDYKVTRYKYPNLKASEEATLEEKNSVFRNTERVRGFTAELSRLNDSFFSM